MTLLRKAIYFKATPKLIHFYPQMKIYPKINSFLPQKSFMYFFHRFMHIFIHIIKIALNVADNFKDTCIYTAIDTISATIAFTSKNGNSDGMIAFRAQSSA